MRSTLIRGWFLASLALIVSFGIGIPASLAAPPTFKARAKIQPKKRKRGKAKARGKAKRLKAAS